MLLRISLLMGALLASTWLAQAHASNQFIEGKEEGWFWYKDPPEEPEPEEQPLLPPPPPIASKPPKVAKDEGPPLFSVKWLQEQLPKLRERAIDNPTKENVRTYLYAQRVMLDKADRFSTMFKRVSLTDPLLDENNRFPFATAFKSVTLRARDWAQKKILKNLSTKAGLFFFYSSSCKYCHFQLFPLKKFVLKHNFTMKMVSMDGKPMPGAENAPFLKESGQAKAWNISVVPAVVLVAPPDRVAVVSQGLLDAESLASRILLAAEELNLLSKQELKLAHLEDRGILSSDDMQMPEGVDPNDPDAWVAYLREKLGVAMGSPDPVYEVLPPPSPAGQKPRERYRQQAQEYRRKMEEKERKERLREIRNQAEKPLLKNAGDVLGQEG